MPSLLSFYSINWHENQRAKCIADSTRAVYVTSIEVKLIIYIATDIVHSFIQELDGRLGRKDGLY